MRGRRTGRYRARPLVAPRAGTVSCWLALALAGGAAVAASPVDTKAGLEPRFVEIGRTDGIVADWVTTDGERIFFGAGSRLYEAEAGPPVVPLSQRELDSPVSDALLAGDHLFLVENGNRLVAQDIVRAYPVRLSLSSETRGRLRLTLIGARVAVAESGLGIRLLEPIMQHHDAGHAARRFRVSGWREVALVPLEVDIEALAALHRRLLVAVPGAGILEYDLLSPAESLRAHSWPGLADTKDLTFVGNEPFWLGTGGLETLATPAEGRRTAHSDVAGSRVAVSGRILHVAAGPQGIVTLRDVSKGIAFHQVNLGNNFFSPVELTIDPGDFVEWRNLAGLHNVFSCVADEIGCEGETSNEAFASGAPAGPPWFYEYQFQNPGTNRYLCQTHPVQMPGRVTVQGASTGPVEVPDGVVGSPMRATRLNPTGSRLEVQWDTGTCPGALDHVLIYGWGENLPGEETAPFEVAGAECGLGPSSPHVWFNAPDPSAHAGRLLWWLVLATDGGSTEGSWGAGSAGLERAGTGPAGCSGQCGHTDRSVTACQP